MYWWIAWAGALSVAVAILAMQQLGGTWTSFVPIAWGVWLTAMVAAFYLEFVPIRKERAAMIESARASHGKADKPAKGGKAPVIEAPREDDATEDDE